MGNIRISILALSLILLSACGHKLTQQDKDGFLERQAAVAFTTRHQLPPSTKGKLPLKAGQWAIVATHFKDGDNESMGFTKFKIIRIQGDTLTMEMESTHAGSKQLMVMAYVVSGFPMHKQLSYSKDEMEKFVSNLEFKRIVMKSGDAKATEIPLNFVPLTKTYMKNLFTTGYRVGGITYEACASDALSSKKCLAYDYELELTGYHAKGHVDAHSSVPIVGYVSQTTDKSESHVIAFGLTGAKGILITE